MSISSPFISIIRKRVSGRKKRGPPAPVCGEDFMAHLRRLWLPAAITAVAAAVPALAQDTPHVKWQGDDAVDLVLDPEYAGTIRLTRDELGTLFGPGEKPFEGEEVTVTVNAGGPKGGISGPLYAFRPVWEELSGGKVNIVELPFAEHYTKMMLDLRHGTGEYDPVLVAETGS